MEKVYTKDMIDEIVRMRSDLDVELLGGMSKDMLEDVIMEIAKRYNAHEEIEANKIAEIKKKYNYDIVEIADKINLNVDSEGCRVNIKRRYTIMSTPFSNIIDKALVVIRDYGLDALYEADNEATEIMLITC